MFMIMVIFPIDIVAFTKKITRRSSLKLFTIFMSGWLTVLLNANTTTEDWNTTWFQGPPPKAFEMAEERQLPILLFWGAAWCPPCNELKSQIFFHPEFKKLTNSVVRVYLDGDSPSAQYWGKKLNAYGYPTILLLDHHGKEMLRISNSVSWDEFSRTFTLALQYDGTFDKILTRALNAQTPNIDDLNLLAYSQWTNTQTPKTKKKSLLEAKEKLINKTPRSFPVLRGRLISSFLIEVVNLEKHANPFFTELVQRTNELAPQYLEAITSSLENSWGARNSLSYHTEDLLTWGKRYVSPRRFQNIVLDWIKAANFIRKNPETSIDMRLWASYSNIIIAKLFKRPQEKLPKKLVAAVEDAAKEAIQSTKTKFERKTVIPSVARILHKIGNIKKARSLLQEELKTSDTPWYFYSALASLEEKLHNKEGALLWSRKAKKSAIGNATKIQWTASDLLAQVRLDPRNTHAVNKGLSEYLELAFSLSDGFLGRNELRASRVFKALDNYKKEAQIQNTINSFRKRCKKINTITKAACKSFLLASTTISSP